MPAHSVWWRDAYRRRRSRNVKAPAAMRPSSALAGSGVSIVPLGIDPNMNRTLPSMSSSESPSNPEKTPWYFLWLQEMVSYSALMGGFIFPLLLMIGLFLVPFLERERDGVGVWFGPSRLRRATTVSLLVSIGVFLAFQWLFISSTSSTEPGPGLQWVDHILNPATGMLLLSAVLFAVVGTATGSTRAAFLAGAVALIVALFGFAVAAWCRGPWWVFYWPWQEWPVVS